METEERVMIQYRFKHCLSYILCILTGFKPQKQQKMLILTDGGGRLCGISDLIEGTSIPCWLTTLLLCSAVAETICADDIEAMACRALSLEPWS